MSGGAILGPASGLPETPRRTRIGDFSRLGWTVRAKCQCGADREVPGYFIAKLFGLEHGFDEKRDIPRIAKALVCGTCKQKGLATVRVVIPEE